MVVKQPANMENGRDEKEEVNGEQVIRWCSHRTGNGSYDGVQPDNGNKKGHRSEDLCTG